MVMTTNEQVAIWLKQVRKNKMTVEAAVKKIDALYQVLIDDSYKQGMYAADCDDCPDDCDDSPAYACMDDLIGANDEIEQWRAFAAEMLGQPLSFIETPDDARAWMGKGLLK
jgi:hypothetical protein